MNVDVPPGQSVIRNSVLLQIPLLGTQTGRLLGSGTASLLHLDLPLLENVAPSIIGSNMHTYFLVQEMVCVIFSHNIASELFFYVLFCMS